MLPLLRRRRQVFVLDDDESMRRLIDRVLRRAGYSVQTFWTGAALLAAIETEPFDLLLLDLMMPVEGGMTVIRHLRQHRPEALRRVAVVTASPESVVAHIRSEVAEVLQKPIEPEELVKAVRRILGEGEEK